MESNDDDEPKICTVFSSSDQGSSKTIFDTIAFKSPTSPKKEDHQPPSTSALFSTIESSTSAASLFSEDTTTITTTETNNSDNFNNNNVNTVQEEAAAVEVEEVDSSNINLEISSPTNIIGDEFSSMALNTEDESDSKMKPIEQSSSTNNNDNLSSFENESILPTANILFSDTPEVPFPVGTSSLFTPTTTTTNAAINNTTPPPFIQQQESLFSHISTNSTVPLRSIPFQSIVSPQINTNINSTTTTNTTTTIENLVIGGRGDDFFTTPVYSSMDSIYEAWIPSEETRKILFALTTGTSSATSVEDAVRGAGQFMPGIPDKSKTPLTTPGIIHEDDMYDKVAVNMARIFGEAEASKRKILTADSVTQDDNGLRELIKLGCYRSAINLTKRLLTLYGQGPGKVGHFSKHSPHSLQLWYSRISLLVRIREFTIADSEVEAFKDFENPDMYYEFYSDLYGKGRRGSLVPFHFRLLAAEIPQYMRKINDTYDKLTHILITIEKMISNITQGICEDGNPFTIDAERTKKSLEIWKKREIRVLYSLANAGIFAKDFTGAVHYLLKLIEKDSEHELQLKSGLGRLFLQFGDITSAQKYFSLASEKRNPESESDKVDTLVDCGLLSIGQNNYEDALNFFKEALKLQPENYMLTNNMAVCLVYLGKVKDALVLMESTVKQNTPQLLQENVILNLSTIYELENSDGSKKNEILKQLSQYKGDGVNLSALKMPHLV